MRKQILIGLVVALVIGTMIMLPKEKEPPYYANESAMLDVEITGAVKRPGVYKVEQGITLAYVINMAGGLKVHADISNVLLSRIVETSTYHIPSKSVQIESVIQRININDASYSALIQIPNITENRALEILLYRKQNGPFQTIEGLLNVKGIGVATFEKIKPYFYI
jgi:competence protein ComEA